MSTAYMKGCRCDECVRENRERVAAWRAKRRGAIPAVARTAKPKRQRSRSAQQPVGYYADNREPSPVTKTFVEFCKERSYDPTTRQYA